MCSGYFVQTHHHQALQRSFQGCMQMIHIDDHLADLRGVEQGLIGTFENVSLDMCAIVDRCLKPHFCQTSRCSDANLYCHCCPDAFLIPVNTEDTALRPGTPSAVTVTALDTRGLYVICVSLQNYSFLSWSVRVAGE